MVTVDYYTEDMKNFVAGLENKHNFPVDIHVADDEQGPFIVLSFTSNAYLTNQGNEEIFAEIARYLVDLRDGIADRGARVTFLVWEERNEEE